MIALPSIKFLLFLAGSTGIFLLSRSSLTNPRSHGFYRFFAFEALLALLLVNVQFWLASPLSPAQLLSWLFLFASAFLAIHAFTLLRKMGRPVASIETTTVLVTDGAYKYIRHPLYASLLYFGWGVFLKAPTLTSAALTLAASIFLYSTAKTEEKENLGRFGKAYADFMGKTKMFIPYLF